MNKKANTYNGKLIYNDCGLYQLLSPTDTYNISEMLNKVYYSNNNYIELKIMNGSKTLFNEEGNLIIKRDEDGIYSYHVNGNNLEFILFENTDKYVDVEIYAEILQARNGEITYDKQQSTK